ncbi:hypothetical protein Ddye_030812 [Dipteronia dyeriana]|uniref:Uncharacterized protein n=1 Tax=Dipteronia dyeriana TaxID=168575 RepID=A0AAD9TH31_9ROSI|nr:hypothetical protein Ddye_030812 [Dipteronia dyeriana]
MVPGSVCLVEDSKSKDGQVESNEIESGSNASICKWEANDDVIHNPKMRNARDLCLVANGHDIKTRNSKFKCSWILEKKINEIIVMEIAFGFDFKNKVRMVDVIAKAFLKLKANDALSEGGIGSEDLVLRLDSRNDMEDGEMRNSEDCVMNKSCARNCRLGTFNMPVQERKNA